MIDNLSFQKFQEIHNSGYTLDHLYLLLCIEREEDVKTMCKESPKLEALYQGIYRKGLITEAQKLTVSGKEFIKYVQAVETTDETTTVKIKPDFLDVFEIWWKAYPGTDTFVHGGRKFSGTRGLRKNKEECRKKFEAILEEGEYTADDLMGALNFEVLQKKNNSLKDKENKITFMQNSLTYLNQRTFEPFIELIRSGINISEQTSTGGTDI
jgi:hypothetical protein